MLNPREIDLSDQKWLPGDKKVVTDVNAAVSSQNAVVTYTMLKVIEEGGNAADAIIAGSILQATLEPFMTNHTGTVTMLYYHKSEDKYYQLDSTGTFPADLPGHQPVPLGMAPFAIGMQPRSVIPAMMPGLKEIHEKFASKPWAELCADAIWWAENGHEISLFEYQVNAACQDFTTFFPEGRKFYLPEGRLKRVGEKFYNAEIVETLRKVAEQGPDYMITGGWADAFIKKANELGWHINKAHMTETPPRWIEPLRFKIRDYEIVSLAPPQQQGIFIAVVLGILDKLEIDKYAPYSAEHIFFMSHALKLATDTCGYNHDPEVLSCETDVFLDEDLHAHLAKLIKGMVPRVDLTNHVEMTTGYTGMGKIPTRQHSYVGPSVSCDSCEISIVDREGNWLQSMNTLQSGGIPGMVVGGVPMVGSHAIPNRFGAMAFYQAKGSRIKDVKGNTFVLKDGKPVLALGTPGNVQCTVPQVLCNYIFYGMEPYQAACEPRMLPIEEGMHIIIEDRMTDAVLDQLMAMGIRVKVSNVWDGRMGAFQMCYIDRKTGKLSTATDPRGCGVADGI